MISFSFNVLAIECPKLLLACNHQILGTNGSYTIAESKSTSFVGVNSDEPSLSANECVASLSFKSIRSNELLKVFVREDLLTFLYVGIEFGAKDPQFYFEATPEKEMTLSNTGEKMNCVLNDPNSPQE